MVEIMLGLRSTFCIFQHGIVECEVSVIEYLMHVHELIKLMMMTIHPECS